MSNATINSISELLRLSQCQYQIYDLGRRVNKITNQQFQQFEVTEIPYPYPVQGHALIAICFWQTTSITPYLWFIKLPLDEQGLLNQAARNHFIAIIIEALGSDLAVDPTEQQAQLLKNNPYHFTPSQYKLAAINSVLSVALTHQPSKYYLDALNYLSGDNGWHNWQHIGVQGLTDVAFRLSENSNNEILAKALPYIPEDVLSPLCSALENVMLELNIVNAIIERYHIEIKNNQTSLALMLFRALSASTTHLVSQQFINQQIVKENLSAEALIIISGRLWQALVNDEIVLAYFEQLAHKNNDELFNAIFKDLVAIPSIRPIILKCIRSPNRSAFLANAIGNLFRIN